VRAAHECRLEHFGKMQVIDKPCLPAKQRQILDA
jgi:hypothetical protein